MPFAGTTSTTTDIGRPAWTTACDRVAVKLRCLVVRETTWAREAADVTSTVAGAAAIASTIPTHAAMQRTPPRATHMMLLPFNGTRQPPVESAARGPSRH